MPWLRPPGVPGPVAHANALWMPAALVFGLVFGLGWTALIALAAWLALAVVFGFGLQLAINEFFRPALFGGADNVLVIGLASLLSALVVAGFLGA